MNEQSQPKQQVKLSPEELAQKLEQLKPLQRVKAMALVAIATALENATKLGSKSDQQKDLVLTVLDYVGHRYVEFVMVDVVDQLSTPLERESISAREFTREFKFKALMLMEVSERRGQQAEQARQRMVNLLEVCFGPKAGEAMPEETQPEESQP